MKIDLKISALPFIIYALLSYLQGFGCCLEWFDDKLFAVSVEDVFRVGAPGHSIYGVA